MSALDRLEGYSARREDALKKTAPVNKFDITTPEGAFLQLVHNKGYKLYDEQGNFTELYTALTTNGNQRIQAIAGSGKALKNGTKVMTPRGNIAIEELKVGDEVFSTGGKTAKVLGVFPQGKKEQYDVLISNGITIPCCEEHLWTVCVGSDLKTLTTLELMDGGVLLLPKVKPMVFSAEIMTSDADMQDMIDNIVPKDVSVPREVCFGSVEMRKKFFERYTKLGGHPMACARLASTLGLYLYQDRDGKFVWQDRIYIESVTKSHDAPVEMTCIMVDSPDHLYIVEGGIPTHNTTMLIFKIMHDIVTGEVMRNQELPNGNVVRMVDKVFVGTFLKSGAEELKQKLAQNQRAMGYTMTADGVSFGTLHAEFKRCLNAMGVATPIGSQSVLSGLLRKAINACSITRSGQPLKQEDYKIIESILMYYRGRLDNERYNHPSAHEYDITKPIIELLNNQYSNLKAQEGIMDFEDLQELLYTYLYVTPNENVQNFVANRYKYIYLDEFQDTSQIQYAILKAYCRGFLKDTDKPSHGKIVVVGDVQQCIYSFRGSCIDVMFQKFNEDFAPVDNTLSWNYRCPSNILKPVVDSISLNLESKGVDIKAFNDGGEFHARGYAGLTSMLKHIEDYIYQDLKDGMSIAILCRTNYDGMLPALYLEMLGKFNFSISSEAMSLNSALPRRLLKVGKIFTEKATPAVREVLQMVVPYTSQWKVKKIVDVLKQNNLSIWSLDRDDLRYECEPLYDFIEMVESVKTRHHNSDVYALKYVYRYLASNIYDGDSTYCESARSCIAVLLHFLNMKQFDRVRDFIEEMEDLGERLEARIGKKTSISIATVHEFKGKERDSIYVWNDSERVFPTGKTDMNNYNQVSEERRVHYIACTRARKRLNILFVYSKPSDFLKEMDCTFEPVFDKVHQSLGSGSGDTSEATEQTTEEAPTSPEE